MIKAGLGFINIFNIFCLEQYFPYFFNIYRIPSIFSANINNYLFSYLSLKMIAFVAYFTVALHSVQKKPIVFCKKLKLDKLPGAK